MKKALVLMLCLTLFGGILLQGSAGAMALSGEDDYCSAEFENLYFDVIINTHSPESLGFLAQSKASQAMHVFMIFDMEVQCGGLATFFWNCESAYADKVSEALIELGLEDVEQLYSGFLEKYGITMEEIDGYRYEYPDYIGIHEAHPFDEFSDAYMEIWAETNLNRRVLDYAREHPEVRVGQ